MPFGENATWSTLDHFLRLSKGEELQRSQTIYVKCQAQLDLKVPERKDHGTFVTKNSFVTLFASLAENINNLCQNDMYSTIFPFH